MTGSAGGAYEAARERYAEIGVSADDALRKLSNIRITLPCWQLDDVTGFEGASRHGPGGGLAVTGRRPGRARCFEEMIADLEAALSLIPGRHRVGLHAMYGSHPLRSADRNAMEPCDFDGWMSWSRERGVPLDFNPTLFAHPMALSGRTLSSPDAGVRGFWIEHVKLCRRIAGALAGSQGSFCIDNLWMPDGSREPPASASAARSLLVESLDEVFSERIEGVVDSLESKLFGIGLESFTVCSHELCIAYCVERRLMPCLDMGHFHPTESVADKVSALLPFVPGILVHVSRGVRWDSDHVPAADDALRFLAREAVEPGAAGRVHLALDFFDASWNRVGALAAAARSLQRALLSALLEPRTIAETLEGSHFEVAAAAEYASELPHGAVWERFLEIEGAPGWPAWSEAAALYERRAASERG